MKSVTSQSDIPLIKQVGHWLRNQCLTSSAPVGRTAWPAVGLAAGWSPSWCWPNAQEAPGAGRQTTCARRRWWNLEDGTEFALLRFKVQEANHYWLDKIMLSRCEFNGSFKVLSNASCCLVMVSSPTVCLHWWQTWDEVETHKRTNPENEPITVTSNWIVRGKRG